jgi:hypothetical protein
MEVKIEEYYKFISTKNSILHVELNGFWTKSIVDRIGSHFVDDWKKKVDEFLGSNFYVLVDMSSFSQPSEAAKEYIRQTMEYSFANGFQKAVEIAPKTLTRMGIRDAASQTEVNEYRIQASSMNEALEILKELKKDPK